MATEIIHIGAGDSEHGHYTVIPGGHLNPGQALYVPVNSQDEMTFEFIPDEGWLIGMVYVTGYDGWPGTGALHLGSVESYTFRGLQNSTAPYDAMIWAYTFPHTDICPPCPPNVEKSFPWWWIALAATAGIVIGKSQRKH